MTHFLYNQVLRSSIFPLILKCFVIEFSFMLLLLLVIVNIAIINMTKKYLQKNVVFGYITMGNKI